MNALEIILIMLIVGAAAAVTAWMIRNKRKGKSSCGSCSCCSVSNCPHRK